MVGLAAALTLKISNWHTARVGWAHAQFEAWAELAANANSYSEQIAEVLLLGESEMPEFHTERAAVEKSLRNVARTTRLEFEFLAGSPARQTSESDDRVRYEQVRALYRDLDRSVEQILTLRALGRMEDAVKLLRDEVEDRFDAELDRLISEGMEDERGEVAETEAEAARYRWLLGSAIAVIVSLALVGTLLAGRRLRLWLVPPITVLAEGAEALGSGDLTRRVAVSHTVGEIEVLATRFNVMAARIEDQQSRLLRNRTELELEVQRRTGELKVANGRLQELDRVRVSFLGDLSHELRTPLTVLRGEAELALRGETCPKRQSAALQVVMRQAAQMERLVSDLLFLARSEAHADAPPLDTRPVVLQEIMLEAVEDVLLLARKPESSVVDEAWPEEALPVQADPLRLKQALLIVLDNALKYSPPGHPVRVGLRLSEDGAWAEATVLNEGAGLTDNELPRAFNRFFRGRNARAGSTAGSGLGLPIAKWIIERHGGTIALDSAPAGPTRLCIRLPTTALTDNA